MQGFAYIESPNKKGSLYGSLKGRLTGFSYFSNIILTLSLRSWASNLAK
jgi:hypothetical protein